jgi:uncharacterized membrane protein
VDKVSRSVEKAVTWRFIATLTTMALAWIVTGDNKMAAKIGTLDIAVKFVLYFLHERVWERVPREECNG